MSLFEILPAVFDSLSGRGLVLSLGAFAVAAFVALAVAPLVVAGLPQDSINSGRVNNVLILLIGSVVFSAILRLRGQRVIRRTLLIAGPIFVLSHAMVSRTHPGVDLTPLMVAAGFPIMFGARAAAVFGKETCEHREFSCAVTTTRTLVSHAPAVWAAISCRELPGFALTGAVRNDAPADENLAVIEPGRTFVATRRRGHIVVETRIALSESILGMTELRCDTTAVFRLPDTKTSGRSVQRSCAELHILTDEWLDELASELKKPRTGSADPSPTVMPLAGEIE